MTEFLCDLFSALAGHAVGACFAWGFFKRRLAADKALAATRLAADKALAAVREEFEKKLAATREKFERDLAATQNRRDTQSASFYELILKLELSQEWMEIRSDVETMKEGDTLRDLLSVSDTGEVGREQRLAVRRYLSHYECVAMAIQEGVISKELYWNSFGGAFVRAWKGLGDYVQALREREEAPELYKEFERLATGTEPEHPTKEES